MVNQTNTNVASEINKLNEKETSAVLDYISALLTKRISKSKENNASNDDLIVSLSDAYENKRARQVIEWESVRRQNYHRAA
jgi:UDP-N-acetylglucosamine pyrophosphorylase